MSVFSSIPSLDPPRVYTASFGFNDGLHTNNSQNPTGGAPSKLQAPLTTAVDLYALMFQKHSELTVLATTPLLSINASS